MFEDYVTQSQFEELDEFVSNIEQRVSDNCSDIPFIKETIMLIRDILAEKYDVKELNRTIEVMNI